MGKRLKKIFISSSIIVVAFVGIGVPCIYLSQQWVSSHPTPTEVASDGTLTREVEATDYLITGFTLSNSQGNWSFGKDDTSYVFNSQDLPTSGPNENKFVFDTNSMYLTTGSNLIAQEIIIKDSTKDSVVNDYRDIIFTLTITDGEHRFYTTDPSFSFDPSIDSFEVSIIY